jgi:predicted amidohydrolase
MARLAALQHAMSPDIESNLETARRMLEAAAKAGVKLAVFPEVQLSPFFPVRRGNDAGRYAMTVDHPAMNALSEMAKANGIVTVANIYFQDHDGTRFDASPVFDADGSLLGISKMVHIAQFENFWEKDYYASGSGFDVYDTAAGRLGIVICYDRHFPESYRACALAGGRDYRDADLQSGGRTSGPFCLGDADACLPEFGLFHSGQSVRRRGRDQLMAGTL